MCPLHHTNVVRLYGGCWNEGADKLCIVLELCTMGSLTTYLKQRTFTWEDLGYGLAVGTAKGLRYLHHEQVADPLIHRDVKPDNIMVDTDIVAKLADFGESKRFQTKEANEQGEEGGEGDALTMTMVGSILYCKCSLTAKKLAAPKSCF